MSALGQRSHYFSLSFQIDNIGLFSYESSLDHGVYSVLERFSITLEDFRDKLFSFGIYVDKCTNVFVFVCICYIHG
jgi:hypothetical protein